MLRVGNEILGYSYCTLDFLTQFLLQTMLEARSYLASTYEV